VAVVGDKILFTKVARKGQLGTRGCSESVSNTDQSEYKPGAVRLQLSREAVDSIQNNVKRYQEFLHQSSHHTDSQFNPWTAVEQ